MARKKSLTTYICAFLLFAGGLGYMVWSGISENSVYFLNVSEALAMPSEELGAARLFGTVAPQNISRPDNGLGANFLLQDAESASTSIAISYQGVVPDTFGAGAEVIVEGRRDANGTFMAKSLMTKCPSKYEKSNRNTNV